MEQSDDLSILVCSLLILFAVLLRPVTTLIHEMGHAIPALLFSRDTVRVFMGTHGDPAECVIKKAGRIEFYFRFNAFDYGRGMCVWRPLQNNRRHFILVTLCGPLLSLSVGLLSFYLGHVLELDKAAWFCFMAGGGSCVYDFIVNMIPNNTPAKLFTGEEIQSDGWVLLHLLKRKSGKK